MIDLAIVEGRLTSAPHITTSQSGQAIAHFTLASQGNYKNRQGQYATNFVNCTLFGNRDRSGKYRNSNVQALSQYAPKGSLLSITGFIAESRYQNRQGRMVYSQNVTVQEFNFLNTHVRSHGGNNNNGQQFNAPRNQQQMPNQNTNNVPPSRIPSPSNRNTPRPNQGATSQSQTNQTNNPQQMNNQPKNKKINLSDDDLPF